MLRHTLTPLWKTDWKVSLSRATISQWNEAFADLHESHAELEEYHFKADEKGAGERLSKSARQITVMTVLTSRESNHSFLEIAETVIVKNQKSEQQLGPRRKGV